jgi:hypothetical protein
VYKRTLALAALGGLIILPACTSGQSAFQPPTTVANVGSQSKLQFQVGTANYNGTPALNTVVTYRQTNGLSALLDSTPVINLPFTNTGAPAGNVDAGTTTITGSAQPPNGATAANTTFGTTVGAFAYGFLASNSSTTGANNSTFYPTANRSPYYGAAIGQTARPFYFGPGNSYVSNFKDGSFPSTFFGYPTGFTTFGLTPVAGTYSLSVGLQGASTTVPTFTATTTLASLAMLGNFPTPTYTSDGVGGGTVTLNVPAGVTETLVEIADTTTGNYYSLVVRGTGPQTATLAPNLGVITGGVAGPSINPPQPATATTPAVPGDGVRVIAVGFDYPALEAAPIGANPAQAPVINNSGAACTFSGTTSTCPGQADLTVSPANTATE